GASIRLANAEINTRNDGATIQFRDLSIPTATTWNVTIHYRVLKEDINLLNCRDSVLFPQQLSMKKILRMSCPFLMRMSRMVAVLTPLLLMIPLNKWSLITLNTTNTLNTLNLMKLLSHILIVMPLFILFREHRLLSSLTLQTQIVQTTPQKHWISVRDRIAPLCFLSLNRSLR
ncbi:hypothetical protein EE074_29530, partial [Klebsiella pneumoniae]|nr:hypothetical protein [Klebsiella pneumoniae]